LKRLFSMVIVPAAVVLIMLPEVTPGCAQELNPCTKDFKKYCSDVTPGGGRLVRCYEEKKDKMSAACVSWAESAKANADTVQAACADMINARCISEKGDPFRMLDCLQSNYSDLSMECRVKLNEFKYRYPKPVQ
jgi:hypothetical protein